MASTATLERAVHGHRPRTRRRWWLLAAALILGYVLLTKNKPERYMEEAAVMERIAALLESPVVYERVDGWFWAPYVTYVTLPRVELDEARTHELAVLLQKLPKVLLVSVYYVRDQGESVEQLKQEIAPIHVVEGLGAFGDHESRQKRTYVAGVYSDHAR